MLSRGFLKKVVLPGVAAVSLGMCSLAVSAAEYTVLLKPGNAMAGAVAVSLHDDGRATLVSYADKYQSKETPVPISTDEVGQLRELAVEAFDDILQQNPQQSKVENYPMTLVITEMDSGVSKTVESRHFTGAGKTLLLCLEPLMPKSIGQYVKR